MADEQLVAELAEKDIRLVDEPEMVGYYHRRMLPEGNIQGVGGYAEVWPEQGKWRAYHESHGGSSTAWADTLEDAVADIERTRAFFRRFWDERLAWVENGDRNEEGRPVIRADGKLYVVGKEPSEADWRANRSHLGMGGLRCTFRMLATGETLTTRNLWYSGTIPADYTSRMPDNAEWVAQ